jgi:HPP family
MKTHANHTKQTTAKFLAEMLVVSYMGIIAFAAHLTGIYLLLFPELAALSHDVLTRPQGKWASQPWRIVLTPTLTAIVGLFVTRNESYGAISVALVVTESLLIIKLLKSAIGPAISAGALPMVLNERSWMYPAAIFVGLVGLVATLWIWRRHGPPLDTPSHDSTNNSRVIDALETYPHDRFWVVTLLTFVLALGIPAQLTGLRFIFFPPLIVMAYELFGHPEIPGWMTRPALFPLVCVLTASVGVVACHLFRSSVVGVMLTVLGSIAILWAFKVHMPPALAVGVATVCDDRSEHPISHIGGHRHGCTHVVLLGPWIHSRNIHADSKTCWRSERLAGHIPERRIRGNLFSRTLCETTWRRDRINLI